MNSRHLGLFVIALTAAFAAQAQQNTVLPDYPNNYTMYEDLVQMPNGRQMGSGNAIDVDSQGNIYIAATGVGYERPIYLGLSSELPD